MIMRILLTFMVCSVLFSCSGPDIDTPEAFGKSAAGALSENDFATFQALLIDDSDMDYVIANTEFTTDAEREAAVSQKAEAFKKILATAKSSFDYFDVFGMPYQSVEYTVEKVGKLEIIRNYNLFLNAKEGLTKVTFDGLVKTPEGWKSTGGFIVNYAGGPEVFRN